MNANKHVIKNRHEFMMFLACKNCNPNGDPDMGNAPRMDPYTMKGYTTRPWFNRRVRDYVHLTRAGEYGMDIFVKAGTDVNVTIARTKAGAGVALSDTTSASIAKVKQSACEKYYDLRAFGYPMNTGPKAGTITGCIAVDPAESLDAIQPMNITVSRVAGANIGQGCKTVEDYEKKEREADVKSFQTFGRTQFIPFGLYLIKGYISANDAAKNGFSEEDLSLFFEAAANMFDTFHSSSKGQMDVVGPVVIFKHVSDLSRPEAEQVHQRLIGRAPARKLFELVSCVKKPDVEYPRSYEDYTCTIDLAGLPAGVEVGFREPFADDIVWGHLPDDETWMTVKA